MLTVGAAPLTVDEVVAVARDGERIEISSGARDAMAASAALVARLDSENVVAYGVTTGFGALADKAIAAADREALQYSLVRSHAAGSGAPLGADIVRGMMLLRARSLCAGFSGVRHEVVDAIIALLNNDVIPVVPRHGSLGASGDLAPLAHAACALLGEGDVIDDGARVPALTALEHHQLVPLQLRAKEGLALINGTDAMSSVMALVVHDLASLLRSADCAAAMSIEALLGTASVFDADVMALRPASGQQHSAANVRRLLRESPIAASHRESRHAVQDAYSLRCTPQVHGAARDLLEFARQTVERELSAVVDNPVVLAQRDEILSNGNFHGQALAYAADCCALLCADVAAISERRVARLLDSELSRGLPPFLVAEPGLNSGLMILQYTAAALVASLRAAATPLSVQSAVTSAAQEDHVSMGFEAALRTHESVQHLRTVLAIEMICAAQALELRRPLRPAPATRALLESLRSRVEFLAADRMLAGDVEAATHWLNDESWSEALARAQVQLA